MKVLQFLIPVLFFLCPAVYADGLDYLEVQHGYFYYPSDNTPEWTESWDLHEENGVFTGGIWGFVGEQMPFPGALPNPNPGGYYSDINTIEEFVPASAGCAALVNGPLVCDMQALGIPLTFAAGFTPTEMPYYPIVEADYNNLLAQYAVATPEPATGALLLTGLRA
jgi:hypothetical protein